MTTRNYTCNFISVKHLELLIMFPTMTSSGDVQSEKMTDESQEVKEIKKKKKQENTILVPNWLAMNSALNL